MTAAPTAYSSVLPAPASGVTELRRDAATMPLTAARTEQIMKTDMWQETRPNRSIC